MFKRAFLLTIGFIIFICPLSFIFAQDAPESNLQFSVDGGKIYFFQPQTGRIFVYQITTNRLSQMLTLEQLGQELKQSRSLSIMDKGQEQYK